VGADGALGPEFDNSYKRGQPLIVKVGCVVVVVVVVV
jgi:FKBP-type peptidyl-prolyl cis-trans isomerase